MRRRLETPLAALGLPIRIVDILANRHDAHTVYDVLQFRADELLAPRTQIGQQSLDLIYRALARLGFHRGRRAA